MDKSLLYKLPKDVLVELVCKNFNNLSIKELAEILKNKCVDVSNFNNEILDKEYHIDDIRIFCSGWNIHCQSKRFSAVIDILGLRVKIRDDGFNYSCDNYNELLLKIRALLNGELFIEKIIATVESIIKAYKDNKHQRAIFGNTYNFKNIFRN